MTVDHVDTTPRGQSEARRVMLAALTGLSVIIALLTLLYWVQSYTVNGGFPKVVRDNGRWKTALGDAGVWMVPGRIIVQRRVLLRAMPAPVWSYTTKWNALGLSYGDGDHGGGFYERKVSIPCWAIMLLALALPVCRVWPLARLERYPKGLCRQCGYDLRATPKGCPECGHRVARSGTAWIGVAARQMAVRQSPGGDRVMKPSRVTSASSRRSARPMGQRL